MARLHSYKKIKKVEVSNGVKVLGIAASPRRKGNSEILLDKVLAGAFSKGAKTKKVILNNLSIGPCQGCERCQKNGICFIRDDMSGLYKKLKAAEAIVVASPVYFGSIPAQLKLMIDRCQSLWAKNFLPAYIKRKQRLRKGIFISVSGNCQPRFFENSKEIIKIFFAVLGVELFKEVYVPGLEYQGEVLKQKSVLDKAFQYGAALTRSCRKTL